MIINIHPDNPEPRKIQLIAEALKAGAVIVYPTDTIYGIGCDIYNQKALDRIYRIKNLKPKEAQFSFICADISDIATYTRGMTTPTFRILKSILPGPYTCILESSREVPKILKTKKDTVGIRVPRHNICQSIIHALGNPIVSTSLPQDDDIEYYTDPYYIEEELGHLVDYVIDGGIGHLEPSTIIDFTSGTPELVRQGAGAFDFE